LPSVRVLWAPTDHPAAGLLFADWLIEVMRCLQVC
jgi:hypothetical protein